MAALTSSGLLTADASATLTVEITVPACAWVAVAIWHSHSRTVSSVAIGSDNLAAASGADGGTGGGALRCRFWHLQNPTAQTANLVITLSAAANIVAEAYYITDAGAYLDGGGVSGGGSDPITDTLDPTAASALCISGYLSLDTTDLSLSGGTGISAGNQTPGRVESAQITAAGVTQALDWGTGTNDFTMAGVAYANAAAAAATAGPLAGDGKLASGSGLAGGGGLAAFESIRRIIRPRLVLPVGIQPQGA